MKKNNRKLYDKKNKILISLRGLKWVLKFKNLLKHKFQGLKFIYTYLTKLNLYFRITQFFRYFNTFIYNIKSKKKFFMNVSIKKLKNEKFNFEKKKIITS